MASKPAGRHLIADFWGTPNYSMEYVEKVLKDGAKKAGATVLSSKFHFFGEEYLGAYTGIIALAESHISVHTWPEKDYLALDIFMCGDCDPQISLDYIKEKLGPDRVVVGAFNRGVET
jgi:S-adenosylmethionine decarboxylase